MPNMERKLIAHGPSSLTIALPHKWVKKNELNKGDTVSIIEDEDGLRITSKPSERKKETTIELIGYDKPAISAVLTTIYRQGYDEIKINYRTTTEYQHISEETRKLLGLAIIENRKGQCIIKSLPTDLEQNFETLFRRVFFALLQQFEYVGEILDSKDELKNFYKRDANLNAIVNLATRMISKGQLSSRFEELKLFHALLLLEECGDDITKFTIEVQELKDIQKLKSTIVQCTEMLRQLYEFYFQKRGTVMEFYSKYYIYWPEEKKSPTKLYESFLKLKDKPVFYLRSSVEKIIQLAELLILPKSD